MVTTAVVGSVTFADVTLLDVSVAVPHDARTSTKISVTIVVRIDFFKKHLPFKILYFLVLVIFADVFFSVLFFLLFAFIVLFNNILDYRIYANRYGTV